MENQIENIKLATVDIKIWKRKYIAKQLKKNPNISIEELDRKIKNAKRAYFNRHHKEFDEAIVKDIQDIQIRGRRRMK